MAPVTYCSTVSTNEGGEGTVSTKRIHEKCFFWRSLLLRVESLDAEQRKKSKEMPIDGRRSTWGITRHQNGRARLGEASRAVLVLSIPTPRQPQVERETTADDGNTHLKQAESRRSRSRSKH
jgi:hypothetical protein